MANSYKRFMEFLELLARKGVPQMLGTVLSAVAIGIGASMMLSPTLFSGTHAFQYVFQWASPYAWGTIYIVSAIAVLVGIFTSQKNAQAPIFMLGAVFCAQGLLTVPQIVNGDIPFSLITCMGLGWICFITQLVCGVEERGHGAKSQGVVNYQP